jgi:2-methylcitrate dehydratase PrpD
MSQAAYDLHGGFARYQAKFDAMLSAHYAAAAILHDRQLTLAQFAAGRYDDPELRRFAAESVDVSADPALTGVQARVDAETADGKTFSVRCDHARGSPENPLTRAQIESKFRTYAQARLPKPRVDEIVATVSRLEDLTAATRLMELLRADDATPTTNGRRAPARAR